MAKDKKAGLCPPSTQELPRSDAVAGFDARIGMRYARRVDSNKGKSSKPCAAGARVKVIHQPVDLKLWATHKPRRTQNHVREVKNPQTGYGKRGLNDKQAEEMDGVPCATVDSVEAALRALAVLRASL